MTRNAVMLGHFLNTEITFKPSLKKIILVFEISRDVFQHVCSYSEFNSSIFFSLLFFTEVWLHVIKVTFLNILKFFG